MAEVLEEHSTQEVVDRNLAIEALKKEMDILEVEKTQLAGEVGGLRTAQAELGELQKKVDLLNKEVDGTKAAKYLAAKRAFKAIKMADNLHKEVDTKRESSTALKAQVELLTKQLEDANVVGVAIA